MAIRAREVLSLNLSTVNNNFHSVDFTLFIHFFSCFLCGIKPMQAASLGMLARKPDSPCCSCLAWCLSTAEKDWKTGEERKSKVLPVPSSREFGKQKVNQKTFSIPPHDMPAFQHILPSIVNVAHTRSCCSPGNAYLHCVAFNVTQQQETSGIVTLQNFLSSDPVLFPWIAYLGTQHQDWHLTCPPGKAHTLLAWFQNL